MILGQLDINAYRNKFRYTLRAPASVIIVESDPGWLPALFLDLCGCTLHTHTHEKKEQKQKKQLWKRDCYEMDKMNHWAEVRDTQNVTCKGFVATIHKEHLTSTVRWQTAQLQERLEIWTDAPKNVRNGKQAQGKCTTLHRGA